MHLAKARSITKPAQPAVIAASLYLALFFVMGAVLQLFAFETFPEVIHGYGASFMNDFALPVAGVVVSLEVLAIPALLWMKLSYLMRLVSVISGWLIILYWLGIGVWQSMADFHIQNAGLFGAKVMLPQGWWLVSYCIILLVLMAYVTWNSRPALLPKK